MEGVDLLTEEDTVCIFYSDNADSMTFDLHQKLNETKAKIIYHKVAVGTKNALDFQLATYLGYLICEQQKEDIHPNYFIVTKDNGFYSLMVYWKAEGVSVRIIRNLLWGKNQAEEQNLTVDESIEELASEVIEQGTDGIFTEAVLIQEPEVDEAQPWIEIETEETENPSIVEETTKISEEIQIPEPAEKLVKKPAKKKNSSTRKNTGKTAEKKNTEKKSAEETDELTQAVEKVLSDQAIVPQVVKFIRQYKTKQGINNALNKEFKDSKRTSEIYSAIKPLIADKKGK